MKEEITASRKREVLSLIPNISFSNVPCWYGAARKDLKMDIIAPKNCAAHSPCPVIVWICGGAYRVVSRSVWLPEMMPFARAGYVVASIEYRTSNEAQFPSQLIDAKSAIRYLRAHAKEYCIDPERIFVMGESAGGTLASLLGVTAERKEFDQGDDLTESSAVQGVVDYYGITDVRGSTAEAGRLEAAKNSSNDVPYWAMEEFLGAGYGEKEAEAASAVHYITPRTPPFMILHGTKDTVVPLEQSHALYDALQRHHIPVHMLELRDAVHGDDLFYQDAVTEQVIAFLNQL